MNVNIGIGEIMSFLIPLAGLLLEVIITNRDSTRIINSIIICEDSVVEKMNLTIKDKYNYSTTAKATITVSDWFKVKGPAELQADQSYIVSVDGC